MGELRQPRGTAFTIRDPLPWADVAGIAREGEGLGYAAVFLPETGARDTLATLTGLAGETEGLVLGTGVIPMGARTSKLAAMAAATVQERSGGRHILGVGTGGAAPGALGRLEDYVKEIRDLVGGSALGAALRLPLPAPVPIWVAALGPKAVRLAGEIADGVILNWCTPERVAEARDAIRVAAGEAGRDPDAVTIAVYVRASFSRARGRSPPGRRRRVRLLPRLRSPVRGDGRGALAGGGRGGRVPARRPRTERGSAWRPTGKRARTCPSSTRSWLRARVARRPSPSSEPSRPDRRRKRGAGVRLRSQGRHRGKGVNGMTYTIAEPCIDVKDRGCVDECPVDCIYEGPRMLYIHPDECVDCGACEPVCPVTAIFYEDDVPAEWKQFNAINAEWFSDEISGVGSPGGAAQVGPASKDHPIVEAWSSP